MIGAIFYFARLPEHGHDWVLAYVIEMGGGAGGASGGSKDSGGVSMELQPMPEAPTRPDWSTQDLEADTAQVVIEDAARPAPRPGVMAHLNGGALRPHSRRGIGSGTGGASGTGDTGGGFGAGTGTGSGRGFGNGMQLAHADYGSNPAPQYPARSRRRAEQGTVILHVLVAADGLVERVEVAESSGFDDLDVSALETVRTRWRFVPARRDGHPVESWVLVPIRFALR